MESHTYSHRAYERIDDGDWADDDGADVADQESLSRSTSRHPGPQNAQATTSFETGHDRFYDSSDQSYELFRKQFFRWMGTAFFAAFIAVTFKIYATKGVINSTQKATFNAIITALSLGLGLNFFEAFKGLAKLLRWRFLAEEHHSIREVDLILGIENLITVVKLGWKSTKKRGLFFFCIIWILLNLSAQVSVALINLTYSLDQGTNFNGTYTKPGTVNVPDLSCFYRGGNCPQDHEDVIQAAAHLYGELATDSVCGSYNTTADILHTKNDFDYYCRRTPDDQEFAYRFSEYNPEYKQSAFPHFTNRIVTASSGPCFQYSEVNRTLGPNLGGIRSAWNYTFTNGSYTSHISIPADIEAVNGTVYIYRGVSIPQDVREWSCGKRCLWMWAHKLAGAGDHSIFFQCPISISQVSNVTEPRQDLSDDMARLAASAIGLQGRFVGKGKEIIWTQYQFYPFGYVGPQMYRGMLHIQQLTILARSPWEVHFQTADHVGANMAEFAIGSISNLAKKNPQLQMQGLVPYVGSRLEVFWGIAITLLVGIVGVHLLLFTIVVYASRVVVIKDDSNLSAARLLHNLIDVLGPAGTFLDGKQLSQALSPSVADGVVYGPKHDATSQGYYLGLGTGLAPRTQLPNRRHPDGKYL